MTDRKIIEKVWLVKDHPDDKVGRVFWSEKTANANKQEGQIVEGPYIASGGTVTYDKA